MALMCPLPGEHVLAGLDCLAPSLSSSANLTLAAPKAAIEAIASKQTKKTVLPQNDCNNVAMCSAIQKYLQM
jgi:hypothetical protein